MLGYRVLSKQNYCALKDIFYWQMKEVTRNMTKYQGLTANQMAGRILNREDNTYKKEIIKRVLDMYADEIYKAMLNGERVQISGVGTIIPEIKTHIGNYNMPICNKFHENGNPPPYTKIRISRNWSIKEAMDRQLFKNIENGILGLKKLPFDVQQINILKKSGFIKSDSEKTE